MAGCRDCLICTRTGADKFVRLLGRLILIAVTLGLYLVVIIVRRMFIKLCPVCGHALKYHEKTAAGVFKD